MEKVVRVLHFTPHNENCGIGRYQERFIESMESAENVNNVIFEASPYQTRYMSETEFTKVLTKLLQQLQEFDILHIQHELSFFKHGELSQIINGAQRIGKKVTVTVHTAPSAEHKVPKLHGFGPHSVVGYLRDKRQSADFEKNHLTGLRLADLVLVHNVVTKSDLEKHGVTSKKIRVIAMPVPDAKRASKSKEIRKMLNVMKGDVVLSTVGFITPFKGILDAVKALRFLPDNYKLAIIGGPHPDVADEHEMIGVCDRIYEDGLLGRVYITGYVEDDNRLNSLIDECDACLYPYDKRYYSYVSSAALSQGLALHKPIVAYPCESFVEINRSNNNVLALTKSFNYYELARSIKLANFSRLKRNSSNFALSHSYQSESLKLISIYHTLLA